MPPAAESAVVGHPSEPLGGEWVVFSICTRNRLHQARCLMDSVRRSFPSARRELLVVDAEDASLGVSGLGFDVTLGADLALPRFRVLAFANTATGLCCLLKPAFALHLLKKYPQASGFVYTDADTLWFSTPVALLDSLSSASVVLTPHRLGPFPPDSLRSDLELAEAGVYNAGVFAFKPSGEAVACLQWWLDCLLRTGVLDARHGYDQAWLSLAPGYFPGLAVCRQKGVNVAYWNLDERGFQPDSGAWEDLAASGLSILHLSTFDPAKPEVLATVGGRELSPGQPWLRELLQAYARQLDGLGRPAELGMPYRFAVFEDGKPVSTVHRQYFRQRFLDEAGAGDNPFHPSYGLERRRGLRSLYRADHWLKALHRRLRSLF